MWFPFLILFLALPKQRLEFPRDDKIKLFHELWWEHFWSWRYTPADWNRFVDPPSTAETTELQQKKFHLVDLRSSGIKVFPFFSPLFDQTKYEKRGVGKNTPTAQLFPSFFKRCEIGFHHKIRCHKTIFVITKIDPIWREIWNPFS